MYSRNKYLTVLLLTICIAAGQKLSAQTISDGEFVDWTFISTGQEPGDQAIVTREPSGGNPGAHLQIETQIPVPSGSAAGLAIYEGDSTTQILDGLTAQFSIDARRVAGDAQLLSLLLRQGNTIYQLPLDTIFAPQGSWANFTFQSTFSSQSLFIRIVGTGPESPDLNGGVVTYFGMSGTNGASGRTYDWDNFSLFLGERQCSDGIDNDLDGLIDHPNDPGCIGPMDDTENTDNLNLVVNPSFEQGPFAWTFSSPDAGTCAQPCVIPSMGLNAAFKNFTGGGAGIIRQTIPTIPGRSYFVELGLAINGSAFGNVTAEFGSTTGVSVSQAELGTSYVFFSFDHIATSTSSEFVFGGLVTGGTFFLDDISVVDGNASTSFECSDGLDNDFDGDIDFPFDPGCTSPDDDSETNGTEQCNDGIDNDADGFVDFGSDPGCLFSLDMDETDPPLFQCNDEIDNDSDALVDYPHDFECLAETDDRETGSEVLDQFQLDGTEQAQAIDSNSTIGQSFTVGVDGSLAFIELPLQAGPRALDMTIEILKLNGTDLGSASSFGSIVVPVSPLVINAIPMTRIELSTTSVIAYLIDLSSLNVPVSVGDEFAFVLSSPSIEPLGWGVGTAVFSNNYPDGSLIHNGSISGTGDLAFKVFVSPPNAPPTARAGTDVAIRVGDIVVLEGGASFDDNTPTASLGYSWEFVDRPAGSAVELQGADTATPSFTVDAAGTYVVRLIVIDEAGLVSPPDDVLIGSDNLAPTAVAGDDRLVVIGTMVSLDGSTSTDPENDPLSYAWSINSAPAESNSVLFDAETVVSSFIPDIAGSYQLGLVVSDLIGEGQPDSVEISAAAVDDFVQIQLVLASDVIENLDENQVRREGNRASLLRFLGQAMHSIQNGNNARVVRKLEKALKRTDGCALRGSIDEKSPGRDWITDCNAQNEIYGLLSAALVAITI